jgi:dolichyl-phosphate-mannose--protein O-mannosyl transferase
MPWKSLLTFLLLAATFLLFCYDYQQGVFSVGNPITVWERIAFRLHFIATAAAALEVWAQGQRARNRPLPRVSLKW